MNRIQKLNLQHVLKELGVLPALYATIVGVPSIVSILQSIFIEYDFYGPFVILFKSFDDFMSLIGNLFEPLAVFISDLIAQITNFDVLVSEYWPQLWAVFLVFVIPDIRRRLIIYRSLASIARSCCDLLLSLVIAIAITTFASENVPLSAFYVFFISICTFMALDLIISVFLNTTKEMPSGPLILSILNSISMAVASALALAMYAVVIFPIAASIFIVIGFLGTTGEGQVVLSYLVLSFLISISGLYFVLSGLFPISDELDNKAEIAARLLNCIGGFVGVSLFLVVSIIWNI